MGQHSTTWHCTNSRTIPLSLVTWNLSCLHSYLLGSNPHSPEISHIPVTVLWPCHWDLILWHKWGGDIGTRANLVVRYSASFVLELADKMQLSEHSAGLPVNLIWCFFLACHGVSFSLLSPVVCTQLKIFRNLIQTCSNSLLFILLTDDFIKLQTLGQLPDSETSLVSLSILGKISNPRQIGRLLVSTAEALCLLGLCTLLNFELFLCQLKLLNLFKWHALLK